MPSSEFIIRDVNFPQIPENIDEELKEYLINLESVLRDSLKGSMFIEQTLESGFIGD